MLSILKRGELNEELAMLISSFVHDVVCIWIKHHILADKYIKLCIN